MDQGQIIRDSVEITLKSAGLVESDLDSIMKLCLMTIAPTGEEDPRRLLASMNGDMLRHLVSNREAVAANPALKGLSQFFFIEWCFREGHLEEDWIWSWEGRSGGSILFKPKVPLDQVGVPRPKP